MEAGRIDSAAHLLAIAGKTACVHFVFDTTLVQTSILFISQYEKQLPDRFRTGIYCNLGDSYASVEDYTTSKMYFYKGIIATADDYDTELNVASVKSGLMYNFQNTGNLDSALLIGYDALRTFEKWQSTSGKMAIYTTLSGVYKYLSDYEAAEKLGDQAMAIAAQARDSANMYIAYYDKIALYDEISHPDLLPLIDTLYHFYNAWRPQGAHYRLGALSLYALRLVRAGNLPEAQKILREIAPLYAVVQNVYFTDNYLYALAEYDLKSKKGIANPALYAEQLPMLKEMQNFNRQILFNSLLSENALLHKDYKNAYYYNQSAEDARDSLREKEMHDKVKELDKKYQTEKKEQQIALQHSQLEQQQTLIGLLIASLSALLLTALAVYLWQHQKRAKKEANRQAQFTQQLFENTEEERSRIARDLHDGVSHELLTLKRSMQQQGEQSAAEKIDLIINDIRQISRNLHPVMLESIGLQLSLETLCDQYMEHGELFITHDIAYNNELSNSAELQVFRIVQEALTNSIKYARANAAKLSILQTNKGNIQIVIQDNGKGFDVERALHSGKSFGLNSMLQRSRAIGGKAMIKSSGQGTVVQVDVPSKIL